VFRASAEEGGLALKAGQGFPWREKKKVWDGVKRKKRRAKKERTTLEKGTSTKHPLLRKKKGVRQYQGNPVGCPRRVGFRVTGGELNSYASCDS